MKTRLLAVLSVSLLVAASAAPVALAQDAVAVGGGTATGGNVQYVDCSQVVNAVQGQYGNATAIGNRAVAAIANEQNITVNQVNACLGKLDNNKNGDGPDDNKKNEPESTAKAPESTTKARDGEDEVLAATVPDGTLPNTGGPSGIVLAAGCALLGVGVIVNRIFR